MPLYEYACKKCEHRFEKIQKFSDKPEAKCPECGGEGKRLLSAPAVHFKGSGWYVTDYARKGSAAGRDDAGKSEDKKPASDTKDAGSKPKPSSTSSKKKD